MPVAQPCELSRVAEVWRAHWQEFKELKKRQAADALKAKVLAIIPGQTVKIRSSRGMFEVTLVRVIESEQKAEVRHENGSNSMVKWSEFDFRPAVVHKPIENEYGELSRRALERSGRVADSSSGTHSYETAGRNGRSHRADSALIFGSVFARSDCRPQTGQKPQTA